MRALRLITVVALLLTLPFFGVAAIAGALVCHDSSPAAHDCCPGEHGAQSHGKTHDQAPAHSDDDCGSCSAATCKTPQSLESNSLQGITFVAIDHITAGTAFTRLPAHSPDLPLRPPQA